MLKKIVKFGNSSALILDKAILELLDMKEGSTVKLKTDGKSLIVTPQQQAESLVPESQTLEEYLTSKFQFPTPGEEENPGKMFDAIIQRQKSIALLNEKYPGMMEKIRDVMAHEEYQREVKLLTREAEETKNYEDYMKKGIELISQFIPDYKAYHDELIQLYPAGNAPREKTSK